MKSGLEWKVGLFALVGLVLLAVLMIAFYKGANVFRPAYNIRLKTANVAGLREKCDVMISGVRVGTVSDVQLAPDGKTVTITLHIYSTYKLYKDAKFAIETAGFLGDKYVAIRPAQNSGEQFKDGDEAEAQPAFDFQEVARSASGFVTRIDETAKRLNDTISDVRKYVLNEETLTNLAVAADNLRETSERAVVAMNNVNDLLATNGPALSTAGTNLVYFSERLSQFAGSLSEVLATNGPGINEAVKNIESSTLVLKNILEDVNAGKGLAGNMLRNQDLAENVSNITDNLSVTTSNLNRLGLWGIMWKHKPPKSETTTK
jgi:phospholipid/cholesterol/gamma-HCH transport system substrate-binding protein